jgi:hypothetical protein
VSSLNVFGIWNNTWLSESAANLAQYPNESLELSLVAWLQVKARMGTKCWGIRTFNAESVWPIYREPEAVSLGSKLRRRDVKH